MTKGGREVEEKGKISQEGNSSDEVVRGKGRGGRWGKKGKLKKKGRVHRPRWRDGGLAELRVATREREAKKSQAEKKKSYRQEGTGRIYSEGGSGRRGTKGWQKGERRKKKERWHPSRGIEKKVEKGKKSN